MRINGTGSALVDNLYIPVDFGSGGYRKWSADNNGGRGIITGGLIFREDLEDFGSKPYGDIIAEITGGNITPKKNIGGPSIVSLIHVMQMLGEEKISMGFFGARGDDDNGRYLAEKIGSFGIDTEGYAVTEGHTPFTDVLADPRYNRTGERSFINSIGAAGKITGGDLPSSFFDADILIYGGTALTPGIHDDLSLLLRKGRDSGCLNFINTVYDFRNERRYPGSCWPLVESGDDYPLIDLLIADNEEAVRISGCGSKEEAVRFFADRGVSAVLITHGAEDVVCFSDGRIFSEQGQFSMPVSAEIDRIRSLQGNDADADTTGCGDNFAGGVYAAAARRMEEGGSEKPSLEEAAAWGIAAGGFASLYPGGVYYEKREGEKRDRVTEIFGAYERQTGKSFG